MSVPSDRSMDFQELPHLAVAFLDESQVSWAEATRSCLGLGEREWQAWLQADPREPEYPVGGMAWSGLPAVLGDVDRIPQRWRLAPQHRHVFCKQCCLADGNGDLRWPTCVAWLDVRTLVCARHDRCLLYRRPVAAKSVAADTRTFNPEVGNLCAWLAEWQALDAEHGCEESEWRNDLVTLSVRNWGSMVDFGAYATPAWELQTSGWDLPGRIPCLPPNAPVRIGELPPLPRIGALLAAHRWWRFFEGEPEWFNPRFAAVGFSWLVKRWAGRLCPSRKRWAVAAEEALIKQTMRVTGRTVISASGRAPRRRMRRQP
jgi:hypothetical protein